MPETTSYLRAAFRQVGTPSGPGSAKGDMRVLAECLGGAAAGFVATLLANAAGLAVHPAVGVGIGLAAALSLKVSRDHARTVAGMLHARPEYQSLLERLRLRAPGAALASRRADAWVVFRPGDAPTAMDERAYAGFRAQAPRLDEVVAEGDAVRVTRLAFGNPFGDLREVPAVEEFDLSTGACTRRGWFADGRVLAEDEAAWRREAADEGPTDDVVVAFRRGR
jgi:hypothetical protein